MTLNIKDALQEVLSKSEGQIQRETANKWASRAIACYKLYARTGDLCWLVRAEEYKHEAVEHAAVADDSLKTLKNLQSILKDAAESVGAC